MKINRIFAALISVICFASCAEFLTEAPTTALSEGSVYSNEANLEAGMIGVYQSMKATNFSYTTQLAEFGSFPSILIRWKDNRTTEPYLEALRLTLFSHCTNNQGIYDYLYASIYKANKMIEAMADSPVDQAYKNEIEGEAKLIRAIQYFTAVRLYGDVPLIIRTPRNIDETDAPRAHYVEVYKQILSDLEYAEQNMRTPERVAQVGGMTGRPHRWAATSFKAAVYTQIACLIENKEYQFFDYQNNPERDCDFSSIGINTAEDAWRKALEAAEAVINSGTYELASNFADLFKWGPDEVETYNLKERIFVLQTTREGGSCNLSTRTLPPYWNGATKNNNHSRFRPFRYVLWKWGTIHGGVPWTGRGDKLENMFKSVPDPRYDASYIHTKFLNSSTGKDVNVWPSNNVTSASYYEPYFRKYDCPTFDASVGYTDLYLMRYAEVYLLAAEAAASLSSGKDDANWQKAMNYMEVIHARARKSVAEGQAEAAHPHMSSWNCQTKEDLINAIMWERVFEMHGEVHEIFDTHRRGSKFMSDWLCKPVNEYLKMPEQTYDNSGKVEFTYFTRGFQGYYLPEDYQTLRKSLLFAFPEHEFRNNAGIDYEDQNDFYWTSMEN